MNRFFGMMPASEIEIEEMFVDKNNARVGIQAGRNGWTITCYTDNTSIYSDTDDEDITAEENFKTALAKAESEFGKLERKVTPVRGEICGER